MTCALRCYTYKRSRTTARLPSAGSFDLRSLACLVLPATPAVARTAAFDIVAEATVALAVAAVAVIARSMQPSLASFLPALSWLHRYNGCAKPAVAAVVAAAALPWQL